MPLVGVGVGFGSALAQAAIPPLFSDTFDRANSLTTLGPSWTAVQGTWGILNNEAYSVTDVHEDMAVIPDVGADNYEVSCSAKGDPWGASYRKAFIVVRYVDADNYWGVSASDNAFQLNKLDGGVSTNRRLSSLGANAVDDQYYAIRVICNGSNIKAYLDGVLRIDYPMDAGEIVKYGTAKGAGLVMYKTGTPVFGARWNNFRVNAL